MTIFNPTTYHVDSGVTMYDLTLIDIGGPGSREFTLTDDNTSEVVLDYRNTYVSLPYTSVGILDPSHTYTLHIFNGFLSEVTGTNATITYNKYGNIYISNITGNVSVSFNMK